MKKEEPKKDQPAEIPVWGTPAADQLIAGVMGNLCAEGNRGDIVSKLLSDGKIKMPGEPNKSGSRKL